MAEASDRAPKTAAKSSDPSSRASGQPEAAPVLARPFGDILDLQAKAGNRAIGRLLAPPPDGGNGAARGTTGRAGALALIQRAPPTVTAPNASMPGPNQSTAPTKMNNGIVHGGHLVLPDTLKCKDLLWEILPAKGFTDTVNFGLAITGAEETNASPTPAATSSTRPANGRSRRSRTPCPASTPPAGRPPARPRSRFLAVAPG
jgi:hypothetical protein